MTDAPASMTPPSDTDSTSDNGDAQEGKAKVRKRPKPGERRIQILQALATMLEQPGSERNKP